MPKILEIEDNEPALYLEEFHERTFISQHARYAVGVFPENEPSRNKMVSAHWSLL